MEIPSKDICVQVYFPQVTKNSQTNCQCVSSQFIASKTQEMHSRGNTDNMQANSMTIHIHVTDVSLRRIQVVCKSYRQTPKVAACMGRVYGRVFDLRIRGSWFDPHWRLVSFSKTLYPLLRTSWLNPGESLHD